MDRARLRRAQVERVDPIKVFDRDAWRCQICGRKTPRERRGSINSNAPELDHIVPLSVGGEHSYRNTQCACRSCNASKGSQVYGQIPMFAT
jgi:5-methylcytosine-specific restriction endonuclease McrA